MQVYTEMAHNYEKTKRVCEQGESEGALKWYLKPGQWGHYK